MSGSSHVWRMHWRLNLESVRRTERRFEREPALSVFYGLSTRDHRVRGECAISFRTWESHTDMSALIGLFSGGGVPFRPVANDGTLTSPAMFCPMPLDCRRRRRMLSLCFVFLLGAPLSSGNGSDMAKL